MTYEDLLVLIPSHSLEDFPTELGDEEAAGLLNAFAVLWHPVLLAEADTTPSWHRADEPPETLSGRLVVIPSCAEDWLPGGWAGYAEKQGACVVTGVSEREELISRVLAPLEQVPAVPAGLIGDFFALGTCYLMVELLTIHMHHFSNLDEVELQRDAVAAAKAAVSGDETAARAHLERCFEILQEARERFYPVDCYLIDLCLLLPRLAGDPLPKLLTQTVPMNLLLCGEDLEQIARQQPDLISLMREAWDGGRLDVAGGEFRERPTPLLPLESVLYEFARGTAAYRKLLSRSPKTWGRRRYGFSVMLPQILNRFGFLSALHVALDDGIYPDAEQSKVRWEGCDGSVVDAITRIPLAADAAGSYLRFPQRMGESMEEDHIATVIFARWPEVTAPWFEDFRRIHRYAPVLGRFVTFEDFFETTDDPGRMSSYEAGEYLSPFLLQSVALEEGDPVSRYARHLKRRQQLNAAALLQAFACILQQKPIEEAAVSAREEEVEAAGPDIVAAAGKSTDENGLDENGDGEKDSGGENGGGEKSTAAAVAEPAADTPAAETPAEAGELDERLRQFLTQSARQLSDIILQGAGERPGFLLLNPLSFARRAVVELPELAAPPSLDGPVKGVQFDERHRLVSVEIPPCGFAWVGGGEERSAPASPEGPALAEDELLRNEFFEVWLNPDTGGIGRIKEYGRHPNRLSQQLAFRFPRERTWTEGEGDEAEQFKSYYAAMRCHEMEIVSAGPLLGEIVTRGEIVDQTNGERLASYRQRHRVYRGLPFVDVDVELSEVLRMPEGDPWTNYYACRWAYNDMTAALTRSVQQGAHGFRGQRFESLHYLEIATPEQRTTIAWDGPAFHRKTGPRMIDSLLLVAGETQRHFRFRIAVDVGYPLQPALELLTPPVMVPTRQGPPLTAATGWFFHLSAKNVQLLQIRALRPEPIDDGTDGSAETMHSSGSISPDNLSPNSLSPEEEGGVSAASPRGFVVRLLETEGRSRRVRLRCLWPPRSARQCDFQGRTMNELPVEEDSVLIEMTAYEIADVEVRY